MKQSSTSFKPANGKPACVAAVVTAICLTLAGLFATPATAHETLGQIIARWREYVQQFRDVPREIRVPESKKFFATIPWDNVEYLCFEGSNGVGPDSVGVLRFVLGYRLEQLPPPVEELVEFIHDADYAHDCKEPILIWATTHRGILTTSQCDLLADAFLSTSTLHNLPAQLENRFHVGAASLSSADTLMSIMMSGARSADSARVWRGLHMLGASIDARAPDSLVAIMRSLHAERNSGFDTAIDVCHVPCATQLVDLLATTYREPWSGKQRLRALTTLSQVAEPAAAGVILAGYGDDGQVVESTFNTTGEDRARYYELWLATRIAEPHLLQWIDTGPAAARQLAIELLDRALWFGPMDDDQAVVAAIRRLAEDNTGGSAARVAAMLERALNPPQTGTPAQRPAGAQR